MIDRRVYGIIGLSLLLAGCSTADPWPKRYPVSGSVRVDGKPAVRAIVTFHPKASLAPGGKSFSPSTFTDDDGSFQLTTVDAGDGAPAGEYTVTVVANYIVKDGQDVSVPDLLGGCFADPKTSPLKVTVREQVNQLEPFDLKSR